MKNTLFLAAVCLFSFSAQAVDWSREAELPGEDEYLSSEPRTNIFQLPAHEWQQALSSGRHAIFHYPVEITELMIPYQPMVDFFAAPENDPFKKWIYSMAQNMVGIRSMQDVMDWLGIHRFEENSPEALMVTPEERSLGMGATILEVKGTKGLTFSCAACHTGELFGKKIIGLTNRFPRANEFFATAKKYLPYAHPGIFQTFSGASDADTAILKHSRYVVNFVGALKPQVLGLDTSLAQVALSLARRGKDEYAQRSRLNSTFPRANALEKKIADSKPAVWWNVKYKTRWLSDGSIVQGNPIHTNFLWNEIGRGIDLEALELWLDQNQQVIDDLTAAVFATEAPRYLDYLPANTLNVELAKRGQPIFENTCARCHGEYEKAWDLPGSQLMPVAEQVKTTKVWYHKKTPVYDVGTDPGRYEGMKHFANQLNNLKISKSMKTVVVPQKGYVPPPLVGIWARWPYFHNNSAPNLCAVLTRAEKRPETYIAGPAVNPRTDYDADCGGYPVLVPEAWKKNPDYFYDTRKEGLGRMGHDEGIFLEQGKEILSTDEKRALIEFLKTL
jgi:hypothetical protein